MTFFVDTSAIYAIPDRDDENHARADATWSGLLDQEVRLLTTNYVLIETSALIQRRLGTEALRIFHEDIAPLLAADWITSEQHDAAVQALLAASRRRLSLVDCASFQCARRHSIRDVFAFDVHFREQGSHPATQRQLR